MARPRFAVIAVLVLVGNSVLQAQEEIAERRATVTFGIGNSMGWLGGQGELYLGGERVSAFVGLGYTPDWDNNASGITFAGGVRGYTRGQKHRGFGELSVVQVAVQKGSSAFPGTKRYYGPALLAGYQYSSLGGFTAVVSAGAGVIAGEPSSTTESRVQAVLNLGVGYTWR